MAANVDPSAPEGSAESAIQAARATVPITAPPGQLSLLSWIEFLGGGLSEGVEFYNDTEKGHYIRASEDNSSGITNGTIVARCPIAATISFLNFDPSIEGLPKHTFVYNRQFLRGTEPDVASAFLFVDQYLKGDDSPWAPYIKSLPKADKLTTTQYFEGEDLEWLKETGLETSRAARLKSWRAKFDEAKMLLKYASNTAIDFYTWDLFLWAMTIFGTRAFTSRVLKEFRPEISPEEDTFSVLVPLLDLSNHRPLTKIEWHVGPDAVGLKVLEDVQPGKEIHNNYGPKNNESLMVNYGFCLGDSTCDYRILTIRAPPATPLYDATKEQRQMFPNEAGRYESSDYYIMNIFFPFGDESRTMERTVFSQSLLDTMGVIGAGNRDARALEIESDRIYITATEYGGSRSFLSGLCQLQNQLCSQIAKAKRGGYLEKTPQNDKQRNAQVYRRTQLMLAQNALAVTIWILERARDKDWEENKEKRLDELLVTLPEDWFGLPVRSRMKSILSERKSIVEQQELFTSHDIERLLPKETFDCLAAFNERALEALGSVFEESEPGESTLELYWYGMFIRFCVDTYKHLGPEKAKTALGPRLARWAPFLLENYPDPEDHELLPEDSDTDYFLTNIHKELQLLRGSDIEIFRPVEEFTGPWLDDRGWLSRSSFRWSWYVAEDEFVQVPDSPVSYVAGKSIDPISNQIPGTPGDLYLYIPVEVEEAESQ